MFSNTLYPGNASPSCTLYGKIAKQTQLYEDIDGCACSKCRKELVSIKNEENNLVRLATFGELDLIYFLLIA